MQEEKRSVAETTDTKKGNAPIIAIIVVILIIVVGYLLLRSKPRQAELEPTPPQQNEDISGSIPDVPLSPSDIPSPDETSVTQNQNSSEQPQDTAIPEPTAKTFTVSGSNFAFSMNEIKVQQGDTVKIVFQNNDGFHDWVVDEFNARTKQINAGATDTVEFVADKAGTFEYYCSVGKHRELGMKGNLIVE
ncbi:MAG TPA: cupredoxin domain-containing protein [Patescibacteria group bacterium]|nr:cupredoxin domain-containing protein [Patescibacteria group bacterium]